jgi:hypothetical protein
MIVTKENFERIRLMTREELLGAYESITAYISSKNADELESADFHYMTAVRNEIFGRMALYTSSR